MEALNRKYNNFLKAYKALDKSFDILKKLKPELSKDEYAVFMSGVIKHFEMAYETAWKFLKLYLEVKFAFELTSPKAVFRACYEYKILTVEVVNDLIKLSDDRNLTVHIYDQATAQEIFDRIEHHYKVLAEIIENITL